MVLLQKVKDVYRALPPWVTAPVKYVPDGLLFGKSFRACEPRTDLACLGMNLKAALDYAREHTVWGRENVPNQVVVDDAVEIVKSLPIVTSADVQRDSSIFTSDEANDFNSYQATTGETGRNPTTVRFSQCLPCKPFLKFFYIYVVKMRFLDGWAGFQFARMQC